MTVWDYEHRDEYPQADAVADRPLEEVLEGIPIDESTSGLAGVSPLPTHADTRHCSMEECHCEVPQAIKVWQEKVSEAQQAAPREDNPDSIEELIDGNQIYAGVGDGVDVELATPVWVVYTPQILDPEFTADLVDEFPNPSPEVTANFYWVPKYISHAECLPKVRTIEFGMPHEKADGRYPAIAAAKGYIDWPDPDPDAEGLPEPVYLKGLEVAARFILPAWTGESERRWRLRRKKRNLVYKYRNLVGGWGSVFAPVREPSLDMMVRMDDGSSKSE